MSWLDLAACADKATRDCIGEPVTYTPVATGVAVAIVAGYWDRHFDDSLFGSNEIRASLSQPYITPCLADLALAPVQGDRVVVRGTVYTVTDIQDDGTATTTRLYLVEDV